MKPSNAVGDPVLVIFSDGSNNAYSACAYVKWELSTGEFDSYLILSKNRLALVKRMSIDRIELCVAVLNKRPKTTLQQQCRYTFKRCYHIVDSQIVHAIIHRVIWIQHVRRNTRRRNSRRHRKGQLVLD